MLEEYIKELEEDLKINELNLKDYQLRLPAIKHKWAGRQIRLKTDLLRLKRQREQVKASLMKEIEQASNIKLTTPTLAATAEKHSSILDINNQIHSNELLIELLEKAEKTLSSCTFDVKNIIEIIKLETM